MTKKPTNQLTFTIMLAFCLVLTILSTVQAFPGNRIVNGTDALPGEIPYIVALKYYGDHTCGGSILNKYWILTAAHCVKDWYQRDTHFTIQYGVTRLTADGANTIPVEQIIYHPKYENTPGYYSAADLAVLKLAKPLEFNEFVQPIALPPAFNATPGGAPAILSGWGLDATEGNFPETLQRVDIQVFADDFCESIHALTGPTSRIYHVCGGVVGGGKGQCSGDSGGPLVVDGVQVGIVSWSIKPCTIAPYPGVFTKVSTYVNWIRDQIKENRTD